MSAAPFFLTPAEVEQITERARFGAQRRALAALGVPFSESRSGRPLVVRADYLKHTADADDGAPAPDFGAMQ